VLDALFILRIQVLCHLSDPAVLDIVKQFATKNLSVESTASEDAKNAQIMEIIASIVMDIKPQHFKQSTFSLITKELLFLLISFVSRIDCS